MKPHFSMEHALKTSGNARGMLAVLCLFLMASCAQKGAGHYYSAALLEKDYNYTAAADELEKIPGDDPIYQKAHDEALTLRAKEEIVNRSRARAEKAIADRDFELARIELRKVLQLKPNDAAVRQKYDSLEDEEKLKSSIESLINRGKPLAAKKRLSEEIKANPSDPKAQKLMARIERDIARRRAAVEKGLKRARELEGEKKYVLAAVELNSALEAWSEDNRAEKDLARIRPVMVGEAGIRAKQAEAMASAGNVTGAISILEQNIEASDDDRVSPGLLKKMLKEEGTRHYLAGDYPRALELWEKFQDYDPDDEDIREYAGRTKKLIKEMQKLK
jgi:tetratricopeptide (TPR) repeat protein